MSRRRYTPEQIIGKLWEGEVALYYGRIPDLRITAMIRNLSLSQKLPHIQ